MKKYWSFFRMRFLGGLQYRAAAWAGVATQFAWGFLRLLMFRAFYEADAAAFPMELGQIASYIWLQQAFLTAFAVWYFDNDIFESITNGIVAYELARPMSLYSMWFVKTLRYASPAFRCAACPCLQWRACCLRHMGWGSRQARRRSRVLRLLWWGRCCLWWRL